LEPNLGVVELDQENSLVLADIPGLMKARIRALVLI
jgi:GTPase involved in cell partitioning and DNA repair